ncbi:ATP-binding protein [Nocardioides sp. MAHUQ-72]|uniref:ATP-binding protein n=1 Tax=unclassified Nocardioides TaxID=2615069 RepID=UPI00361B6E6A
MSDADGAPGRLELSAPADPSILDLVHALLEHLWSDHPDVSDGDRMRFEMAVIEVLANIVEHAYRLDHDDEAAGERRRFDVTLAATDDELVARFADNGLPMELDLSDVVMPDEMAESGRGLALAASALDDLAYDRVEGRNHWRLQCVRRPG